MTIYLYKKLLYNCSMPILKFFAGVSKTTLITALAAVVIILGGGAYYVKQQSKPPVYETVTAERRDIQETISVTGKVVAAEEIDLAFEKGGRIATVNVEVGQIVEKDTVLASLSASDSLASVAEARANVAAAEAGLNRYEAAVAASRADLAELERGSREEEVTLARSKVTKANQALSAAEKDLTNTKATAELDLSNLYDGVLNLIADAFNDAENAVEQQADQFFNDPHGIPELNFTTGDTQAENSAETNMVLSEDAVDELRALATAPLLTETAADLAIEDTLDHLNRVNSLLFDLTATLNSSNTLSTTTAAEYASDIATARSNINTDITNLTNRQQSIASQRISNNKKVDSANAAVDAAKESLTIAENELSITLAGATVEQLDSARAALKQAEANLSVQQAEVSRAYAALQRQNAELSKTNLVAPFKGVITEVDVTTGEIVAANQIAISMISDGQFEIEANVPEADIANLVTGNKASFTLDAFEDTERFEATVATIDPAETVTDGIATYEIKLILGAENKSAKPGMTADVRIVTNEKKNTVSIPLRAIERGVDGNVVTILNADNSTSTKNVTLGLRDSTGNVEIVEGLSAGTIVVIPGSLE